MTNERYFQVVKGAELTLAENLEGWHWCGLELSFLSCCKGDRCSICKYNPKLAGPF